MKSTKRADHWSRFKTVSFQKVLMIITLVVRVIGLKKKNFFSPLALLEDYEQGALRKKLIIAPLKQQFETGTFRNSY